MEAIGRFFAGAYEEAREELKSRAPIRLAGVLLASALLFGCAASRKRTIAPSAIRPVLEASASELAAVYNSQARAVESLNATVRMTPVAGSEYSGVIQEYHEVGGFILMAQPAMIRVIGQAPVVSKNIFDMVSDGQTFHIFIPSKNQFLEGSTALERAARNPIENLRPQHVLDAFFWPQLPVAAPLLFEQSEALPERYYILTGLRSAEGRLEIDRKIWFDRADLRIVRVQVYGPGGRLDADVAYADWQPGDTASAPAGAGLLFPRRIVIRRPQQDYQLTVMITKLMLNAEISADRFVLAQPPGTKLVRVGQDEPNSQPTIQP